MRYKKILISVVIFLIIWYILNLLPVIPVEYSSADENTIKTFNLPTVCSLNYVLSCLHSVDDFGTSYPALLKSDAGFFLTIIILPLLITWLIVRLIDKNKLIK